MADVPNSNNTLSSTIKTVSYGRQKVVILPGPHKTGSTSVQSFLASLTKKQLLGDWEWPASSSKAFSEVAHSVFFDPTDKHGFLRRKRSKIQSAWRKGHNVVFGAELFDWVAAMSPEELPRVFERLFSVFPPTMDPARDMTAVVMYRTPRSSHLVSAWKQQIAMAKRPGHGGHIWRSSIETKVVKKGKAPSLAEWLCTGQWSGKMQFNVDKIVEAQINPMAVAAALMRYGNMSVIVGDMSNMTDISNTIACKVLKVPCTDENRVVGWNKTKPKVLNQRENPAPLGLSETEMQEVEDVLRRMDCYHYCELKGNITILHAKDAMFTEEEGWKDCCASPEKLLSPAEAYQQLKSIGCRASGLSQSTHSSLYSAEFLDMKSAVFDVGEEAMNYPLLTLAFPFMAFGFLLQFQKRRRTR